MADSGHPEGNLALASNTLLAGMITKILVRCGRLGKLVGFARSGWRGGRGAGLAGRNYDSSQCEVPMRAVGPALLPYVPRSAADALPKVLMMPG